MNVKPLFCRGFEQYNFLYSVDLKQKFFSARVLEVVQTYLAWKDDNKRFRYIIKISFVNMSNARANRCLFYVSFECYRNTHVVRDRIRLLQSAYHCTKADRHELYTILKVLLQNIASHYVNVTQRSIT